MPQQRDFQKTNAPDTLPADFNKWDFQQPQNSGAKKPVRQPQNFLERLQKFFRGDDWNPEESAEVGRNNHPMPGVSDGPGLARGLADYDEASFGQIGGGAGDVLHGDIAKGGHKIISGATNALTPLAPMFIAAAPGAALRAGIGGYVGSKLAGGTARIFGATEDQQDLAGDIGGITGGWGGVKLNPGNALKRFSTIGDPDVVGGISPRLYHWQKVAGRVANRLNRPASAPTDPDLMKSYENATSGIADRMDFEPAEVGAEFSPDDSTPALKLFEHPIPERVPVWANKGINAGHPPVQLPEPMQPATPRTQALAQSGLPQPKPFNLPSGPEYVSADDVLSHITGENKGFELPRVVKKSPLDLSADEIISTSKRGPIRPAADIQAERKQGGWNAESDVRPLINANKTLQQYRQFQMPVDQAVNEMDSPLMRPEEVGWRHMQFEQQHPGSWASKYPSTTPRQFSLDSAAPDNDLTDVLQRSIEQANAKKAAAAQAAGAPSFPIVPEDPLAIHVVPQRPSILKSGFVPNQSPRRFLSPDLQKLLTEQQWLCM